RSCHAGAVVGTFGVVPVMSASAVSSGAAVGRPARSADPVVVPGGERHYPTQSTAGPTRPRARSPAGASWQVRPGSAARRGARPAAEPAATAEAAEAAEAAGAGRAADRHAR